MVSFLKTSGLLQKQQSWEHKTLSAKFELDQIIFLDFTGIGILKYKEIRVSGAKLFEEYIFNDSPSN